VVDRAWGRNDRLWLFLLAALAREKTADG